jgi:hypothetical protein
MTDIIVALLMIAVWALSVVVAVTASLVIVSIIDYYETNRNKQSG